MSENKLNSVHLDGILEGVRLESQSASGAVAWASVITLHPKAERFGGLSVSDRYERLRHDVRLVAEDAEGVQKLKSVLMAFDKLRHTAELYPCSLSGSLAVEGNDSFVSCDIRQFLPTEVVKTNDNNVINLEGVVDSVIVNRTHATLGIKVEDGGVLKVLVSEKNNPSVWKGVSQGDYRKGDTLYMNGPLLSQRLTDGEKTVKMSAISPHVIQKRGLDKRIRKKGPRMV